MGVLNSVRECLLSKLKFKAITATFYFLGVFLITSPLRCSTGSLTSPEEI